jgi:hypothetical protein
VKTLFAAGLLVVLLDVPVAYAQSGPEKGGHDMEIWTSGGLGFSDPTSGTGVWNIGVRYGWILTEQHGPGILRGRFEFAADVVPVFWVFQPSGTAYGFSLNPIVLKWNLKTRRFIAPYFELFGGTVFTNHPVPDGTSRLNFTGGASLGMNFLRGKYYWGTDVRFLHISNGDLVLPNPGINSMQIRLAFGLFTKKK